MTDNKTAKKLSGFFKGLRALKVCTEILFGSFTKSEKEPLDITLEDKVDNDMKKWELKFEKMRQHSSERVYGREGISNDKLGNFYVYDNNSPHSECFKCDTHFTEGDHVYLTNYFHEFDVLTPFPYCKSCIQDYLVAQEL